MTESLDPHNARAYRKRARPMLFIGVLLFALGLRGYLLPATSDDTAAHALLGSVVYDIWHAGLTLAGLTVVYGLLRLRPDVEIVGLRAAMWAACVHGVAAVVVFSWRGTSTVALVLIAIWVFWGRIADLRDFALREHPTYDRRRRPRGRP